MLGLTELLPQWYVSAAFFVYTILDAVWIFIQPAAIPRWASKSSTPSPPQKKPSYGPLHPQLGQRLDPLPCAGVIFIHHIITALLITHPLRHADHSVFTCLDGLVEVNTFLLIARRSVHFLAFSIPR